MIPKPTEENPLGCPKETTDHQFEQHTSPQIPIIQTLPVNPVVTPPTAEIDNELDLLQTLLQTKQQEIQALEERIRASIVERLKVVIVREKNCETRENNLSNRENLCNKREELLTERELAEKRY